MGSGALVLVWSHPLENASNIYLTGSPGRDRPPTLPPDSLGDHPPQWKTALRTKLAASRRANAIFGRIPSSRLPIRRFLSLGPSESDETCSKPAREPSACVQERLRDKRRVQVREKQKEGCNTRTSQEVTHLSTALAQARLTSEF